MLTALAGLAASATAAIILFPLYGHVGIAWAISACGFVSAALLGISLLRRGWLTVDAAFRRRMALIVVATALMGAAVVGLRTLLAPVPSGSITSLATMMIMVVAGLGVYLASLRLFGVAQITSQDDERRGS
jgi:putative peptidoglycan lipid II flippase